MKNAVQVLDPDPAETAGAATAEQSQGWRGRLSVRGQAWAIRSAKSTPATEGLPPIIRQAIANRGIADGDVKRFLSPDLGSWLPADPFVIKDLKPAVLRLFAAIRRGERITVFGDFDVDGATSTATMVRYLRFAGADVNYYIPDRMTEGYGPNGPALEKLAAAGTRLLVCVDSGTTAHDALARGRAAGLDIVVIDHHAQETTLPDVHALVNPNRHDDESGLGHLCAAGLCWVVVHVLDKVLRRQGVVAADSPSPVARLLAITGLGTVADVVPLTGLNRAFVANGLCQASALPYPGFAAMAELAATKPPFQAWHHGFVFGPRINAAGRIGDSMLGARLLITDDADEAMEIAARLEALNDERKAMCTEGEKEAIAAVEADAGETGIIPNALVVASPSWHPGIIGIVAGRIKEHFNRPVFALAIDRGKGIAKGSGRSVPGVDLGALVHAMKADGLLTGGGHPMAAGVTVPVDNIEAFRARLVETAGAMGTGADTLVDFTVTPETVSLRDVQQLEALAPFGQGNPQPLVAVTGCRVNGIRLLKEKHVKVFLSGAGGASLAGILFNAVGTPLGDYLVNATGDEIDVLGRLEVNTFRGRSEVQVKITDALVRNRGIPALPPE